MLCFCVVFLTWLNFKIISRNWLAFSPETHNVDVLPCFYSKAVQWCFNEPLPFTVHPNGPVLSWLTVPLMVHVVNSFLLDEQPRVICDISFVFRSEAPSLFHFLGLLCSPAVRLLPPSWHLFSSPSGEWFSPTSLHALARCWNLNTPFISRQTQVGV